MKKKNLTNKLSLQKKTITHLTENQMPQVVGGALSIKVCQLSQHDCEPSWNTACVSHLSGCPLCPTFGGCES